jgi:hypothetical protein
MTTSNTRRLRAKEQAELIKAQNEAEANKPVRLAAFECIICMSNPTDLTVTHCGMYSVLPWWLRTVLTY